MLRLTFSLAFRIRGSPLEVFRTDFIGRHCEVNHIMTRWLPLGYMGAGLGFAWMYPPHLVIEEFVDLHLIWVISLP